MSDIPLIWTTKGNLPVDSLEYKTTWEETPENTVFVESYLLDGEVVKQSVHVKSKRGLLAEITANSVA